MASGPRRIAAVVSVALAAGALWLGWAAPSRTAEVAPRPAPALPGGQWLNTPEGKPLKIEALRGKVVLVEFWTFACLNCRHTLPAVKEWHRKYAADGLVIVGVHTPELEMERSRKNVEQAVAELGISYPVAFDNDFACWNRYQNRYWPAFYLVDPAGRIVYQAIGEHDYAVTEKRIQALLAAAPPGR